MQLPSPTSGTISFNGTDLTTLDRQERRRTRRDLQMIFQDPISSLNPRRKIKDIVAEGIQIWGLGLSHEEAERRVEEVLSAVGLDPALVGDRRAHQFSGGQCQRICIARSLILDPEIIICDEPVSALDVSVQAQILNLLQAMKSRYDLTLVFIAHDLAVVKNVSDRVAVLYLGKMCEIAPADALYDLPAHPYTRALLESVPRPDPHRKISSFTLGGELPSPINPPSGCRFRTRCDFATERCADEEPQMQMVAPDHFVACHHPQLEPSAVTRPDGETSDIAGQ